MRAGRTAMWLAPESIIELGVLLVLLIAFIAMTPPTAWFRHHGVQLPRGGPDLFYDLPCAPETRVALTAGGALFVERAPATLASLPRVDGQYPFFVILEADARLSYGQVRPVLRALRDRGHRRVWVALEPAAP